MATALGVVFELEGICSQSLQQVTPAAGCTVIREKKKETGDKKRSPGWLKWSAKTRRSEERGF